MLKRILLSLIVVYYTGADTVDNGLLGEPVVECGRESLTVRFGTQSAFEGHVYVKGHYKSGDCRRDASLTDSVNLTVPYAECDVLRQRSSTPKGLMMTSTVIISFHPMFVTKIDKSYKVQCFYSEVVKSVTNQLDVSVGREMEKSVIVVVGDEGPKEPAVAHDSVGGPPQPTEEAVKINVPLPECKYEVLSESKTGEEVKFATVGQQVYHQWSCHTEGNQENIFCATVHSCVVREEGGKEVQLLDENGCAVDRFLLNNLEYTSDLVGGQVSQVFKFADQPSLFFQCQIRLSIKEGGTCIRSSDHCPAVLRGKRSVSSGENDVDVFSQKMTVFDLDDPISSHAAKELGDLRGWASSVCVSPSIAGSMVVLLASFLLVTVISVGLLCRRPHSATVKLGH